MAAKKKKTKKKKQTLKITISGPQGVGKSNLAEVLGRTIDEMSFGEGRLPEIWIDGWRGAARHAPLFQDALRQATRIADVIEIITTNKEK